MDFLIAALALVALQGGVVEGGSRWEPVWRELNALEALPRDSQELQRGTQRLEKLGAEREAEARRMSDRPEALRARVLRSRVRELSGVAPLLWNDPGPPIVQLGPTESWLVARYVLPGPTRVRAFVTALSAPGARIAAEDAALALRAARGELSALRLADADAIASALDAAQPTVDSASLVAHVATERGDLARARAVLEARASTEGAESDVWALSRARVARAELDEPARARVLGAAVVRGSARAALALARDAWFAGEPQRCGFAARAALSAAPDESQALELFGLARLPTSPVSASTEPSLP